MKALVIGASGGTGLATVRALVAAGHEVTAFVRDPATLPASLGAHVHRGDVLDTASLHAAITGQDAVIVALGFSGRGGDKAHVCATGTANVIAAMQGLGRRRLIVVTSLGVGATRAKAPFLFRLVMDTILKPQIADKLEQERLVRASDLDWTIVQPVGLSDKPGTGQWLASPDQVRKMQISRSDVGAALARLAETGEHVGETLILSG